MWVWHKENRSDLGIWGLRVAPKGDETHESAGSGGSEVCARRCVSGIDKFRDAWYE